MSSHCLRFIGLMEILWNNCACVEHTTSGTLWDVRKAERILSAGIQVNEKDTEGSEKGILDAGLHYEFGLDGTARHPRGFQRENIYQSDIVRAESLLCFRRGRCQLDVASPAIQPETVALYSDHQRARALDLIVLVSWSD